MTNPAMTDLAAKDSGWEYPAFRVVGLIGMASLGYGMATDGSALKI